MDVFEHLAGFDATQPDGLLVALAAAPGVDDTSIDMRSWPRPGGHGHHTVQWHQDGRKHTVEAHTHQIALERAVRAASGVSAKGGSE